MNKKQRNKNRIVATKLLNMIENKKSRKLLCVNCGMHGKHWVIVNNTTIVSFSEPNSSDEGFWICRP